MRNRKTIMGFGLLAAVLFLAVGYAAISNIDFSITGTASAEVDTGLFEVAFDKTEGKTTTSNTGTTATVTASVTGDQSAEFGVTGLKSKNETVTATYTIVNSSEDLDAELSNPIVTLSGDNTSFYDVTAVYGNGSDETPLLESGDSITLTVTVKMKKTPIDSVNDVKSATINISFTSTPVQPGSSDSNGSSVVPESPTNTFKYYGQKYSAVGTSSSGEEIVGYFLGYIVFYEDGSLEEGVDGQSFRTPAGILEFKDNKIWLYGEVAGHVSQDQKEIILLDGLLIRLEDESIDQVYFEEEYSMITQDNKKITLIFYKDGTMVKKENGVEISRTETGYIKYTSVAVGTSAGDALYEISIDRKQLTNYMTKEVFLLEE